MSETRPPRVSVVIPTYNRSGSLEDAVRSVLDQTFADLEVIVVDDGSTDDTREMVVALQSDPRLRCFRQRHRGRAAAARNMGIRHSRGELIGFLDDDDIWLPTKLERQVAALAAEPGAGVAWCALHKHHVGADGGIRAREIQRYRPERYREPLTGPFIHGPGSTILVRAECFDRVGMFDEVLGFSDMDMVQRLGAAYAFVCLDEPLVVYRLHEGSMSADPDRMVRDWRRYMARLRRRTPPDCHHLIPVALLIRNGGWVVAYLRAGHFAKARALLLRSMGIAVRHPLALPRALLSFGERALPALRRRRPAPWQLVSYAQAAGEGTSVGRALAGRTR
jgi:glycosyltransferase involved in cell wall biosynthesis